MVCKCFMLHLCVCVYSRPSQVQPQVQLTSSQSTESVARSIFKRSQISIDISPVKKLLWNNKLSNNFCRMEYLKRLNYVRLKTWTSSKEIWKYTSMYILIYILAVITYLNLLRFQFPTGLCQSRSCYLIEGNEGWTNSQCLLELILLVSWRAESIELKIKRRRKKGLGLLVIPLLFELKMNESSHCDQHRGA